MSKNNLRRGKGTMNVEIRGIYIGFLIRGIRLLGEGYYEIDPPFNLPIKEFQKCSKGYILRDYDNIKKKG